MADELLRSLPFLLPKACSWAERQSRRILTSGAPLPPYGVKIVSRMGVGQPDRVRIVLADPLPEPDDGELFDAYTAAGLLGSKATGLTFGYAICLRTTGPSINSNLLAHEARHVFQYEQAGSSIEAYLVKYLAQVFELGLDRAPLELDARKAAEGYT